MSTEHPIVAAQNKRLEEILATLGDDVRMLRLSEVTHKVGLSRTSIYDMMRSNAFPKPYRIGGSAIAWLSSDVKVWIAGRMANGPIEVR